MSIRYTVVPKYHYLYRPHAGILSDGLRSTTSKAGPASGFTPPGTCNGVLAAVTAVKGESRP